jgi:hypothetical protein
MLFRTQQPSAQAISSHSVCLQEKRPPFSFFSLHFYNDYFDVGSDWPGRSPSTMAGIGPILLFGHLHSFPKPAKIRNQGEK